MTPEQYKLVRTPEFKAWFGDWENDPENASKVVDSNGEPLIMYHGTLSDFNIFDKEKWGYNTFSDIRGFFFSNGKEEAQSYMEENVIFGGTGIKNGFLLECFLNLKEPIIETIWDEDEPSLYIDNQIHLVKYNKGNGLIVENKDKNWVTAVVFEPNQIKLADGTNTTFDPNSDDIRFETGGTVLLAPNGKPSNLTTEQYKLVRTPEFKAWFGDWENDPENASKVVDFNGEPLVVYHGTEKGGFTKFDEKRIGENTKNADIGFYFSNTFQNARSYSDTTNKNIISSVPVRTNYTVFLNLKNPKIISWGKNNSKASWNTTVDGFNGIKEFVRSAYEEGFDGAIAKNIDDTGKNDCFYDCGDTDFIAFEPNQIKLADGTNITFDPNNDDIRYRRGGRTVAQTPAPSKERIYGSDRNKPRSSKDSSSAESIKFDNKTLTSIENKVEEHNEAHPDKKVNLATAKAVVRRGMGAYSKSHRPTISGRQPNSRVAWGLARLNAFLYKVVHGVSKSGKYSQDNDLLDELGIAHKKFADGGKTPKKSKRGDCYVVAGRIALNNRLPNEKNREFVGEPYLIHAQVIGQGAIAGLKYGHAWVEDDIYVYDYSNGRELKIPKEVYYKLGQVIEKQPIYFKYTFGEAKRKMAETGHFGSWDLITESGL